MADAENVNKVRFHSVNKVPWLKRRTALKTFIVSLIKAEGQKLGLLDVVFCTDRFLLRINQQFLRHDTYTDIITFDLTPPNNNRIISEIYISVDRVLDNSSRYATSKTEELLRVLFHGVLHLCGYGDKSARDKRLMREKEEFYLKKFHRYVSRETRST